MSTIKTFGDVDARSLEQLERCMAAGDADFGVLCADHHLGYSQPIGGAIAYEGYVSPSGVGYDIGCGNKAVADGADARRPRRARRRRGDHARDHAPDLVRHGRSGDRAGRPPGARQDPQRRLRAAAQAGAARRVAARHGRLGQPLRERDGGRGGPRSGSASTSARAASATRPRRASSRSRRVWRSTDARSRARWTRRRCCSRSARELGEAYIAAMELAGEYAYAGRDVVVAKVLEILGAEAVHEVHNHHNFAWREEHFGRTYWVVRKGCTPARPGQEGFVGGSMGDESVILEGVESADAERVAVLDGARRRPRDEPDEGGGPRAAPQAVGVHATATATALVRRTDAQRAVPRPPDLAPAQGLGRGAALAAAWSTGRPSRRACASRASCWSAAARTRRRRCTSACRRSSPRTATRSG